MVSNNMLLLKLTESCVENPFDKFGRDSISAVVMLWGSGLF